MGFGISRRSFVATLSASIAAALIPGSVASAHLPPHPVPRRGITGAKVLSSTKLAESPKLIPLFDSVREIPEIVDGIRCNCGCPDPPEYYSLLSCYEGDGMARNCVVCQSQARLVVRLNKEGKSLDQIRAAVDAKFG